MAEIVNLNRFKKQKTRDDKNKQAEQNRLLYGRTKADKNLSNIIETKSERFFEQNRLEKEDDKS